MTPNPKHEGSDTFSGDASAYLVIWHGLRSKVLAVLVVIVLPAGFSIGGMITGELVLICIGVAWLLLLIALANRNRESLYDDATGQ